MCYCIKFSFIIKSRNLKFEQISKRVSNFQHFMISSTLTKQFQQAQNFQASTIQQQQTAQHNIKQLIQWINSQISKKNIPAVGSVQQLWSGNIFLEIISIYYPKKVDLTKIYIKPKDDYEILQNYKQLLSVFIKLGWKKFDAEKFRKRKDKDLMSMAQFLKKILSQHLFGANSETSSNIHSLLTNYPTVQLPEKEESYKNLQRSSTNFIKIQDRKLDIIKSQNNDNKRQSTKVHHQSQLLKIKSENIKNNKNTDINSKNLTIHSNSQQKQGSAHHLAKPQILDPTNPDKVRQIKSPRLPPHPHKSSMHQIQSINPSSVYSNIPSTERVILSATQLISSNKNNEQQLNNFQNVKISKLQKQKSHLLKKIMQIQKLLARQKHLMKKQNQQRIANEPIATDDNNNNLNENNNFSQTQQEKFIKNNQKIQQLKRQINQILKDVQFF